MDATASSPSLPAVEPAETDFPIPDWSRSEVVLAPDDPRPGNWVGAPSAVLADGSIYLAYRVRRPIGRGRGVLNVVARSRDGVRFETVAHVHKDDFGAASLERPALVRTPEGRWRLYVSCATEGTSHWRVDAVEADRPEDLGTGSRPATTVLPGDARTALKDPVVVVDRDCWHLWVCVHDIPSVGSADAMYTAYATSEDGWDWSPFEVALAGRPGRWDQRGARISSVIRIGGHRYAFYDGRSSSEQNWEEQTGVAHEIGDGCFRADGDRPVAAAPSDRGGLRYVSAVDLGDAGWRLYYEGTRPDGAHELRTEHVPPSGAQRLAEPTT